MPCKLCSAFYIWSNLYINFYSLLWILKNFFISVIPPSKPDDGEGWCVLSFSWTCQCQSIDRIIRSTVECCWWLSNESVLTFLPYIIKRSRLPIFINWSVVSSCSSIHHIPWTQWVIYSERVADTEAIIHQRDIVRAFRWLTGCNLLRFLRT